MWIGFKSPLFITKYFQLTTYPRGIHDLSSNGSNDLAVSNTD